MPQLLPFPVLLPGGTAVVSPPQYRMGGNHFSGVDNWVADTSLLRSPVSVDVIYVYLMQACT